MITHSYIVSCLKSYEIAQDQIRWLAEILPGNWELIFVDDGSTPPIPIPEKQPKNTTILRTHDYRPWTQDIARNRAAREAQGEYLLMTDIDHVFTVESIRVIEKFTGKMCHFPRQCGRFVDGKPYPAPLRVNRVPPNIYLIRRDIFLSLGGYDESLCGKRYRATDKVFLDKYRVAHGTTPVLEDAEMYVIPEQYGTFHGLERK